MKHRTPLTNERIEQLLAAIAELPDGQGTIPVRVGELRSLLRDVRTHRNANTHAAQLLAACQAQHDALDILFARLIMLDVGFFPSLSGAPWDAMVAGHAAIARAEQSNS